MQPTSPSPGGWGGMIIPCPSGAAQSDNSPGVSQKDAAAGAISGGHDERDWWGAAARLLPGDSDHLDLARAYRPIGVGLPDDHDAVVGLQRGPRSPQPAEASRRADENDSGPASGLEDDDQIWPPRHDDPAKDDLSHDDRRRDEGAGLDLDRQCQQPPVIQAESLHRHPVAAMDAS